MNYGMRFVTLYRRQGSIIPMEKKCKKAKRLSKEALQIAVKRREAKSEGEKERYIHLNTEFQRIVRRDKKAFTRDQCKKVEENNRMSSVYFQGRPFNIIVIQAYAPTSSAEEAEVEWFYEDLQDLPELTPK